MDGTFYSEKKHSKIYVDTFLDICKSIVETSPGPCHGISLETGCYFFIYDANHNWNEARKVCKEMGARLVVIETEKENRALVTYIQVNHTSGEATLTIP